MLPTPATVVTTTPYVQLILGIIQDIGVVLMPVILAFIAKYVHNAKAQAALGNGIRLAAGGVYEALVAEGKDFTNVDVKNAKIASAVNATAAIYPAAMKTFGMDADDLHEAIRKEFGTLLAADPTVTVTPSIAAPIATSTLPPAADPAPSTAPDPLPVVVVGDKPAAPSTAS